MVQSVQLCPAKDGSPPSAISHAHTNTTLQRGVTRIFGKRAAKPIAFLARRPRQTRGMPHSRRYATPTLPRQPGRVCAPGRRNALGETAADSAQVYAPRAAVPFVSDTFNFIAASIPSLPFDDHTPYGLDLKLVGFQFVVVFLGHNFDAPPAQKCFAKIRD